jgi:serine/threonine protein phosphatase 1
MVDTGACYGGDLSAYCPETQAVIAVPGVRAEQASPLPGFRASAPEPAAALG